jgi:hypothetical protein
MREWLNTVLLLLILAAVTWVGVRSESRRTEVGRYVVYNSPGVDENGIGVLDTSTGEIHVLHIKQSATAMHLNPVTGHLRAAPATLDGKKPEELKDKTKK